MSKSPVIFWFRDDLRLIDNPGLASAAATGSPVIAVYLLDEMSSGTRKAGGALRWWLDKSLRSLSRDIAGLGGRLILRKGDARGAIPELARECGAMAVYWSRRYGRSRQIDEGVAGALSKMGVAAHDFTASVLLDPADLAGAPSTGYRVYSPFWRALQKAYVAPPEAPRPKALSAAPDVASDALDAWALHPRQPDWSAGLSEEWTPGEKGARSRLTAFIEAGLQTYADDRNRPDLPATSRLSPHLRFGEIGPSQVWRAATSAVHDGRAPKDQVHKFLSEIAWREFSYHLLHHDPDMSRLSWRREFDAKPWRTPGESELDAWRYGHTGYPIVDAGMRQLWRTGWMHNRVRMIVGSFLCKDMLAHWRVGEDWFWDTLVDADEANNAAGWQWIAGSGADAAPFFRVFNPVLQGQKFDPEGAYVRAFVPELAALPDRWIHSPKDASAIELAAAGVKLGATYPEPMLDHKHARERALQAMGIGAAATE